MPLGQQLFQLTYYSAAKPGLATVDIDQILATSRKHNGANDITGCLLFHNSEFLQILEGEENTIRELFVKIQNDSRHESVLQLAENNTERRLFEQCGLSQHFFSR